MEQIQLGDQTIGYDGERTRAAYAAMKNGSAERCWCPYCRNFAAQRSTVYPESFRLLLDELGIDPEKESEVYEGSPEGSLVGYAGWFFLAGELIEPGERMTDAAPGFQYFFARRRPTPQGDFGQEVLALEFSTKLPWVISEKPEWLTGRST
jgi:hypothetical protein